MSMFLDAVIQQAILHPDRVAFRNAAHQEITYRQLDKRSNALAQYILLIQEQTKQATLDVENKKAVLSTYEKRPVGVYGHKDPAMLVCMIACMKAGCPYVVLDTSFPRARIDGILQQLEDALVLSTAVEVPELSHASRVVVRAELEQIMMNSSDPVPTDEHIANDDIQYILFTSGSTGSPKGVMQRAETIDCMTRYFHKFIPIDQRCSDTNQGLVCFNRVPFSFDASLFDMVTALPYGHTMFSLEEVSELDLRSTFDALRESNLVMWTSTPTFLDMCLRDPAFSEEMLPQARVFLICGEVLHNSTVCDLYQRFPRAVLYNCYGPTETESVTDILITQEMAQSGEPLPIGYAGPDAEIQILDRETLEEVPYGKTGEIYILGEMVAAGYYGRGDLTQRSFSKRADRSGLVRRCYKTGDEGFMDPDGCVHYCGRFDLQVKVNGYRIELEEIEEALNAQPEVAHSCVLPIERNGSAVALAAHVVLSSAVEANRATTKALKEALKQTLPAYMIPRTFTYHEHFPVNSNGKTDRKVLAQLGSEKRTRNRSAGGVETYAVGTSASGAKDAAAYADGVDMSESKGMASAAAPKSSEENNPTCVNEEYVKHNVGEQ